MPLGSYIAGFAALGFGVRCYQLAIMKRNIFENLGGHALSVAAFSGVGYYAYNAQESQRALLADKKEQLLRMREKTDEQNLASYQVGGSGHGHGHH
ncbi:hypothetical protein JCM8097_005468 [Rhodosporidiobolus ruineniae]